MNTSGGNLSDATRSDHLDAEFLRVWSLVVPCRLKFLSLQAKIIKPYEEEIGNGHTARGQTVL